MKMFTLSLLLLASVAKAETFVCHNNSVIESGPHDTFIITVVGDKGYIQYQRHAFFGSEEFPLIQDIPGCVDNTFAKLTDQELYVECIADGDAGYLSLDLTVSPIKGTLAFPEGNIGYSDDTYMDIVCRK